MFKPNMIIWMFLNINLLGRWDVTVEKGKVVNWKLKYQRFE